MSIIFDDEDRFLIDRWETAAEFYGVFCRIQEKLGRLNDEAFGQLKDWARTHGLSASSEEHTLGVYRENWCDPSDGRHRVELIVDHVSGEAVFVKDHQLLAGVWCGDLRSAGCGNQKDLRKQFGERLRSLISRQHPILFSNRREPEWQRLFLVGAMPDVSVHEIVVSEGKFSELVIAEFERLYPVVALVDEVICQLDKDTIS